MGNSYLSKAIAAPVEITLVMVLGHSRAEREMEQGKYMTRCIKAGEVHELVAVAAHTLSDGKYHGASYIGFAEFNSSAVIHVGEKVFLGAAYVGVVGGFDYTHFPNHINILIEAEHPRDGQTLRITTGQKGRFGAP